MSSGPGCLWHSASISARFSGGTGSFQSASSGDTGGVGTGVPIECPPLSPTWYKLSSVVRQLFSQQSQCHLKGTHLICYVVLGWSWRGCVVDACLPKKSSNRQNMTRRTKERTRGIVVLTAGVVSHLIRATYIQSRTFTHVKR